MVILPGFFLFHSKHRIKASFGHSFFSYLSESPDNPESEEKWNNKEDDFPKFPLRHTETLVNIVFRFFFILTIEKPVIRKHETDGEIDKPSDQDREDC